MLSSGYGHQMPEQEGLLHVQFFDGPSYKHYYLALPKSSKNQQKKKTQQSKKAEAKPKACVHQHRLTIM